KEGTYNLDLESVPYFKSDRRMIEAVTTKGNYVCYGKLDEVEEALGEKGFLRVYQRYLVNLVHIARISEGQAFLKNGEVIGISRNRYKETLLAFGRGVLR
ncbi:MAG: LytR/AlgR family response regulator transcription factor, partial [Cellulosilyticaceae bacterium]